MVSILEAPKSELHMHLEGSLEPELRLRLAARNGLALPYATAAEILATYEFADLQGFLDVYRTGLEVLRTEQDFYDLTYAYMARVHEDYVVHAEPNVTPQAHTHRGVPFEAVLGGTLAAFDAACDAFGMTGGVILGLQRQRGEDDAFAVLDAARPYRDRILALGMGGPEVPFPPAPYARVYDRAREYGWHTVVHAGEEGPPSYVADALDVLRVERVDHGVRCEGDPALVRRLAERQVPLTVCPLSNAMLKVFPRLEEHNLRRLLHAGIRVTMSSDDPPYFGGYVNANYAAATAALGLTEDEQFTIARNGFLAAFLDDERRACYIRALDAARTAS